VGASEAVEKAASDTLPSRVSVVAVAGAPAARTGSRSALPGVWAASTTAAVAQYAPWARRR
jgi:hypothetical protein